MPFEISGYHPKSVQLFSRCARSHAQSKNPSMNLKNIPKNQPIKNIGTSKLVSSCPFEKTESREQRQKRYKKDEGPSIGQYNPKRQISLRSSICYKIPKKPIKLKPNQNIHHNQINHLLSQKSQEEKIEPNINQLQPKTSEKRRTYKPKKFDKKTSKNNFQTVKSQVDMSRMTGRARTSQSALHIETFQTFTSEIQTNKKVQKKNKSAVNFDKQISREKASQSRQKNGVLDYSFNYEVVKPKYRSIVPYSKHNCWKKNKMNETAYSYTHYDFDSYVWSGKSSIYPNTKTSVIDFNKTKNRYN